MNLQKRRYTTDNYEEKIRQIIEDVSSITDAFKYYTKHYEDRNKLIFKFRNIDNFLSQRVEDYLESVLQQGAVDKKKRHVRRNSYEDVCLSAKEEKKLKKESKILSRWALSRSCYDEDQKSRLKEFKDSLQQEICCLLLAIHILSSKKVSVAKETSSSKSLDNLIGAAVGSAPFPGASPVGMIWSLFSPLDRMINGSEKDRLNRFSKYLTTPEKISRFSEFCAAQITAYYRAEILDQLCNLSIIESTLEPYKRALCNLKEYVTSSNFGEQYIKGTSDKKERPDEGYKEHWESLRALLISHLFNNILLSDELLGSNISIESEEMARRLVDSLTPVSDEPLNFEKESLDYTLSRLALLVYDTEGVIYDFVKNKWRFKEYQFFHVDDIQSFLFADDEKVVISFRGTMPLTNWPMYNFRILGTDVDEKKVHSGFWAGMEKMRPHLKKALKANDKRKIYITGHSLGGALALLTAFDLTTYLDNEGSQIHLCTFGQPKSADQSFVDGVIEKIAGYIRYVNFLDPVPHLPPNFEHGGILQWIDPKGVIHGEEGYQRALAQLEEEDKISSLHNFVNYVTRSETKAIRTNHINKFMHMSNHWMIEYHNHLRAQTPGSYTSSGYIQQVAFKRAQKAAVYEHDSQNYRCEHPTRGDGACAIHAICGTLSRGEYVYNPQREANWDAVKKGAKQHFIDTLESQLGNEKIQQLFMPCLQESFDEYEKDTPLRQEYNEILHEKKRTIASLHGWIFPILEVNPELQGKLLGLLRQNNKADAKLDDQELLEVFRRDCMKLYFAVAAVKDEITLLVTQAKEEEEKRIANQSHDVHLLAYSRTFIRAMHNLNRLEQETHGRLDELLRQYRRRYMLNFLSRVDLTDNEIELAAYLFSKKIILFSKHRPTFVYNEECHDCIAIEHTPGHYSRLEKEQFSLATQEGNDSINAEEFDFNPLILNRINAITFKMGFMRTTFYEAAFVAYTAPCFLAGKTIQMVVSPNSYERDAQWHFFQNLKQMNPPLKLFDYIAQGSEIRVVEAFFKDHKSFYRHPKFPISVLPYLIFQNNAEMIDYLNKKGIRVNTTQDGEPIRVEDGSPLVHHLVPFKCYASFEALIRADDYRPDTLDKGANTVLHLVAQHGDLKALAILRRHEKVVASILNFENGKGQTAIVVAVEQRQFRFVDRLLLDNKDDIELSERFLSVLVKADAESALEILFSHFPKEKLAPLIAYANRCEERGVDSILFRTTNRKILKLLIKNGIDLTKKQSGSDKTLLYMLAKNNDVDLVKPFIKKLRKNHEAEYQKVLDQEVKSSQINKKTKQQQLKTALIIAAEKNNYEVVELLIEAGADFRKKIDGLSPSDYAPGPILRSESYLLLWRAYHGVVKRKLTSREKLQALMQCCSTKQIEGAEGLIIYKIFPLENNREANKLLRVVVTSNLSTTQKFDLLAHLWQKIAESGHSIGSHKVITPLHLAAYQNFNELKGLLKQQEVDVDCRDINLWTPLHVSAYFNRPSTIKTLLASHANPQLQNSEGQTPLHLTREIEIAGALIDKGANPLTQDFKGKTPRDYANANKNYELAKFLKECEDRVKT